VPFLERTRAAKVLFDLRGRHRHHGQYADV
jgi:hypothetical protein